MWQVKDEGVIVSECAHSALTSGHYCAAARKVEHADQLVTEVRMSESPASWMERTQTLWSLEAAVPINGKRKRLDSACQLDDFCCANYLPSSTLFPSKWRTLEPPRMDMYSSWVLRMAGQLFEMMTSLDWPFLRHFMVALKPINGKMAR